MSRWKREKLLDSWGFHRTKHQFPCVLSKAVSARQEGRLEIKSGLACRRTWLSTTWLSSTQCIHKSDPNRWEIKWELPGSPKFGYHQLPAKQPQPSLLRNFGNRPYSFDTSKWKRSDPHKVEADACGKESQLIWLSIWLSSAPSAPPKLQPRARPIYQIVLAPRLAAWKTVSNKA